MSNIQGLIQEQKFIEHAIDADVPVLLVGPTGCGKTSVIHSLAKKKKKVLVSIPLNGQIGREELVGKFLIKNNGTYWQDGILTEALRNDHWVLFDEINAALPEVLFLLHSLLDHQKRIILSEKDNEVIQAGDNFRFFATMNPVSDYAGTKELNMAFMSRFGLVLNFNYPDYELESSIIAKHVDGLTELEATKIALLGGSIRELHNKNEVYYPCSTRDLISVGRLVKAGSSLVDAMNLAVVNKYSKEEKDIIAKKTEVVVRFVHDKGKEDIIAVIKNASKINDENKKIKEALSKIKAANNGFSSVIDKIEI